MKIYKAPAFVASIPSLVKSDFLADTLTPLDELKQSACDGDMKCKTELFVTHLQAKVVTALQQYEPNKKFQVDSWRREEGGGGITTVLQDGDVWEKAGVNISVVSGELSESLVQHMRSRGKDLNIGANNFFATGISCVLHPVNPFISSIHFNYRYFEVINEKTGKQTWWFGGGTDISPNYIDEEDIIHFHRTQKEACDAHDPTYYPKYKKWADDYFYSPYRGECRGVGGLFYDDLDDKSIDDCFSFMVTCGNSILPSYIPLVDRHINDEYTDKHRNWQLLRRGRYVEFNLVYDRGTKFGLSTPGARIESILMSLPLLAKWEYMPVIESESEEEKMMAVLKKAKDWV